MAFLCSLPPPSHQCDGGPMCLFTSSTWIDFYSTYLVSCSTDQNPSRPFIFPSEIKDFWLPLSEIHSRSTPRSAITDHPPFSPSWRTSFQNPSGSCRSILITISFYPGWKILSWLTYFRKSHLCFAKFNLRGNFQLGHLDNKHMLIKLNCEGDFNRLWLKEIWYVNSFPMRTFRWTLNFCSDIKSSFVPIWESFPHCPLFLFNKQCMFSNRHGHDRSFKT